MIKNVLEIDEFMEKTLSGIDFDNSLTKREEEILSFIVSGSTNKDIARKIYRTERTVEYHRNRLMRKLGTHSTADLIRHAISIGIV